MTTPIRKNYIKEKQMALFLTKTHKTPNAEVFGTVKQSPWIFPDISELLRHHEEPSASYGSSPVMFTEKSIFEREQLSETLLRKSTFKIFVRHDVNTQ